VGQLRAAGVEVRVGQRVPMVYIRGERPGVHAWRLPQPPAWQVLQPFGLCKNAMERLASGGRRQQSLWANGTPTIAQPNNSARGSRVPQSQHLP